MCGITGIWNWSGQSLSSRTLFEMSRSQKHRGPDGHGYVIWDNYKTASPHIWYGDVTENPDMNIEMNLGLGHNWLAIQDAGRMSQQPMCFDNRYWIVFNGEIYNFIELRNALIQKGYKFQTGSDTEVILTLWDSLGEESINHLRGMFAFIIYDSKKNMMWACRDRFGIKPLYYSYLPGKSGILFGSEYRSLFASSLIRKRWNETALVSFLACGINKPDDNATFFEDIYELPPGDLLRIKPGNVEKTAYYRLSDANKDYSPMAVEKLKNVFTETIGLHLRSTKEVGTCLSGGLDSTNIAFAIKEILGSDISKFKAFTIGSEASSDLSLAKTASEKLDSEHHIFFSPDYVTFEDLAEMIKICETPNHTWGPINQYYIMRFIKQEHGIQVLLDGQGGDETFSGYPWFFKVIKNFLVRQGERSYADNLAKKFLEKSPLPQQILDSSTGMYFSRKNWIDMFDGGALELLGISREDLIRMRPVQYYLNDELDWHDFYQMEFYRRELQHLLRQEDRLGMWYSIENRVPFLDHVLVEEARKIGPKDLWKDGYSKHPLRIMFPEMPEAIRFNTDKKGFWENYSVFTDDTVGYMKEKITGSGILNGIIDAKNTNKLNIMSLWRFFQIAVLSE